MELSLLIFKDLLSKFCVGIVGFLAVKCKICGKLDSTVLASICLFFAGPCQLFNAFRMDFDAVLLVRFGIAAGISAVILSIFVLGAFFVKKIFRVDAVSEACLVYSNNGSFLLALVSVLLGNEAVFYLSAFTAMQNIFFWTHGYMLLSGRKRVSPMNLLNPNVMAIVAGLIFFLGSIHLHPILTTAFNSIGDMNGPLCMIMVGMALASCNFKETFTKKIVWLISLTRLLLFPGLVALLVARCGIVQYNPDLMVLVNVLIIAASGPAANNVLQVALLNIKDNARAIDIAASVNTVSTCLCIFTIPAITMLYQFMCQI